MLQTKQLFHHEISDDIYYLYQKVDTLIKDGCEMLCLPLHW